MIEFQDGIVKSSELTNKKKMCKEGKRLGHTDLNSERQACESVKS